MKLFLTLLGLSSGSFVRELSDEWWNMTMEVMEYTMGVREETETLFREALASSASVNMLDAMWTGFGGTNETQFNQTEVVMVTNDLAMFFALDQG